MTIAILHKLVCVRCKKPITRGQDHCPALMTPKGPVVIHAACMGGERK